MNVGIGDKLLMYWMKDKAYFDCSDEGEAVAIGAGYFLATGKRANVFMSADGFMNALNFLTSWVIPENIEMNLVISIGRKESQHYIATEMVKDIVHKLESYGSKRIHYKFITAE